MKEWPSHVAHRVIVGTPCASNKDCKPTDDLYCHLFTAADGLSCGTSGQCVRAPAGSCLDVVDPVCGCDGRTYDNVCKLGKAHVAELHAGACP